MDKLLFGLSVMAIGMLVVFAGLVILIFCVKGITALAAIGNKKGKAAPQAEAAPSSVAATSAASEAADGGISDTVLAAITAAVATVLGSPSGFVVRHVKRVHNAPAWNRAGREEQTYSRF